MITRCYLEITNICNLNCCFCPKTARKKHALTIEEFELLAGRLRNKVKFLYFHLMGEPLLHPHLPHFILRAKEYGFIPVITTNGTLLGKAQPVAEALPHKVQISLHSHEGNGHENIGSYISGVMNFALDASSRGVIIVLRLWNRGGLDSRNSEIEALLERYCPRPWNERHDGWCLGKNIYLEYDNIFEWPDSEREEFESCEAFCYALRNQIGVLADGTVVPCCLDHNGDIAIGNLFEQSLDDILASPRATAIFDGFTRHEAVEPLCRRCGYATVTKRFRK